MSSRILTQKEVAEAIKVKTGYNIDPKSVAHVKAPNGDSMYYIACYCEFEEIQFICREIRHGILSIRIVRWY